METRESISITVHGIVQGVGFRPFVFRLANSLGLGGTVINDGNGVQIMLCGPPEILEEFVRRLPQEAPPVARIASITTKQVQSSKEPSQFTIEHSAQEGKATVQITPDIALCSDCLSEINDPKNRRHRYPFTNCTNCGPRFTIIKKVPYDRPNTSMAEFPMCPGCEREYHDPMDRRFHAQPNACPVCGPSLRWHDHTGEQIKADDCLHAAAEALSQGNIVAIKGLGGFHLAADAYSKEAVALLRHRKNRPAKPLAVMAKDLATAQAFCEVSEQEQPMLTSPEHPIVLLKYRTGLAANIAPNVAPNIGEVGVMLPYTPLHALLLAEPSCPEALVMTSGNAAGMPICIDNDDALSRLSGMADFFLLHNRDIVTRVDDSVVRVIGDRVQLIRRARGYAPVSLALKHPCRELLACGAAMKNTFCIVRNSEAYVSQHIGELTSLECFDFYQESIEHLKEALQFTPDKFAVDLHPDYISSRYGQNQQKPWTQVQHHHAHVGAVMAEHGLDQPVLGVILDGTGFGGDGSIFGGEIYRAERNRFERKGHLSQFMLPGGDKAAQEPWRMALSLLYAGYGGKGLEKAFLPAPLKAVNDQELELIGQMLQKNLNTYPSSSCGRLFDGIAALIGLCQRVSYEGQAAMQLEYLASQHFNKQPPKNSLINEGYQPIITNSTNQLTIDTSDLIHQVMADIKANSAPGMIALRFHGWLIRAITAVLAQLREQTAINTVTLSGGCMHNRILLSGLSETLTSQGFEVFSGELFPVNDGGIALGQAYIGGAGAADQLTLEIDREEE